jgi:hypothetical protein
MNRIRRFLRAILPEEKKNLIPCVSFGAAMLVLMGLNVWKWVVI